MTDLKISRASLEQYRRLAAAPHHMQVHNGLRTLMVASAYPGDGKTLMRTFGDPMQLLCALV